MKTNRWIAAAAWVLSAMLTGCASTSDMAFKDDDAALKSDAKPLYLMTVTLRNEYKPDYQPQLQLVSVSKAGSNDAADRLIFRMDDKARSGSNKPLEGNTYFLRMPLEPGTYEIRDMFSWGRSFAVIGGFSTPIHSALKVGERGVFYLGHIDAKVRERKEQEFRAGPVIPLIDQSLVGASGGTFDVKISDKLEEDGPAFRKRFPALRDATITKAMLAPFDRAKAQEIWEKN